MGTILLQLFPRPNEANRSITSTLQRTAIAEKKPTKVRAIFRLSFHPHTSAQW